LLPTTRIIINPSAQHGVTEGLIEAVSSLFYDADTEVLITESPRHGTDLAAASAEAGCTRVIAVGGDGTISEVINGLMRIDAVRRPLLGIIPSGSGNDIARLTGVPVGLSRAFTVLQTGTTRSFDVGRCNDHFFFSSFSVGLDALVVAKTVEYKERHRSAGLALYLRALLYTALHNFQPIRLQISYDGSAAREQSVMLCAVTNGKTYGGGIRVNPWAEPDNGLLASSIVANIRKPKFISCLPLLIAAQQNLMPEYQGRNCRRVSIVSPQNLPIIAQCDGEVFSGSHFEVDILPLSLQVIVPEH
jgi:YegS/Rv2252/BmrU family lipid kinase